MLNSLAFTSLQRVSNTLQSMYQMRLNGIHRFKHKVQVNNQIGSLIIKTAETSQELKAALKLRHDIFHQEFNKNSLGPRVEVDEFDVNSDHLIIIEKKTGKLVGTIRLSSSLHTKTFRSARHFNIRRILDQPGEKVELGRPYIHKDYQSGIVTALIWRGISEYMNATKSQILFSNVRIKTSNPREGALLYKYFFEDNRMRPEFSVSPTTMFHMPSIRMWMYFIRTPLTFSETKEVNDLITPLCKSFLKMGAFIGGEPAWDHEFKCIDFLTILRREDLNKTLWKRYKVTDEPS